MAEIAKKPLKGKKTLKWGDVKEKVSFDENSMIYIDFLKVGILSESYNNIT